jgi:hypothetical protein
MYFVESQQTFRSNISPPSSVSKNKPNKKPAWKQAASFYADFLLGFFWRWRRYVPPKCRLTFNGLHGVISQKIVGLLFFIITAVITSNPTCKEMKSIIFWYMTPCSPLSCTRRFGGTSATTQRTTGVISQKMILFITTAVKTSNPTCKEMFVVCLEHCSNIRVGELRKLETSPVTMTGFPACRT